MSRTTIDPIRIEDELAFQWLQYETASKPSPADVTIIDSDASVARFVPPVEGTYLFAVKVSDGLISVLGITSVFAEAASDSGDGQRRW